MPWFRRLWGKIRGITPADIRAWVFARPVMASWLKIAAGCLGLVIMNGAEGGNLRQIECVALNIYFEARNEPEPGRRAVAHVVLNRRRDARWPDTACAVITQGWPQEGRLCQFSWYCDGRSDTPRSKPHWRAALAMAKAAYWGRSADPTGGALWYHADYVKPSWRKRLRRGPKIGRHIFYGDRRDGSAKQSL